MNSDFLKTALQGINDAYITGMRNATPADAEARALLCAAVEWHQRNESEPLPTPLLAILVAARRVC